MGISHSAILKLSQIKRPLNLKNKFLKNKWEKSLRSACNDKCSVYIEKVFPNVENIHIVHEGCILSRAATNAIISEIEHKTRDEAYKLVISFKKMLEGQMLDIILPNNLLLFKKFSKFPSRWNCLLMGANLILKILERN